MKCMKLIKFFGMTIYWVVLALISFYVYSLDYNQIKIENWTDFQKVIFAMAWLFKSIFTIIFILFFVNHKNKDLWCFCILILYLIIFPALLIYMFSKEEILSYIKFIYIIIDIILFYFQWDFYFYLIQDELNILSIQSKEENYYFWFFSLLFLLT